ncbi:MAG: V-type ATPase subunit [Desulfurococcales archaeon]|nr:V-type ATPase subunit [Desulfurococcales archaeon]
MPGPGRYAKTVPKLRTLKASLLTHEQLRELSLSPSLDDASALLRDTPYSEVSSATMPSTIQTIALKAYFGRAQRILKVLPEGDQQLVLAFLREDEIKDLLAIMRSIYTGTHLPLLPTASIEGTLTGRIRKDPEALVSMQRLLEALDRSWFKSYARQINRIAQEMKTAEVFTWYSAPASLQEYTNAIAALPRRKRREAEALLCPVLEYKIASTMVNGKALRIPLRIMDRIMRDLNVCGATWDDLRQVYEREPGPQEVLSSLRELLPRLRLEAKQGFEVELEAARRRAWREAYRRANAAYSGYPFTPTLVLAAMILAKAEYMDVTTILTGVLLKMKPDEIQELTIIV